MARNDSFRVRWASNPAQFERPQTSLIERGWAGGANEDPPEAKWENWWHNRVDEALAEVEANGALNWQPDVPYEVGATVRDDGVNWICAIPNNDIRPSGGANDGHWLKLAAQATESEFGAVRLADAATAQGLTDAQRALTSAALAAVLGTGLPLGNGYASYPFRDAVTGELRHLIVQWGTTAKELENTVGFVSRFITFPITFPTECLKIAVGYVGTDQPLSSGFIARNPTREGFMGFFENSRSDQSVTGEWIAVGW